MPELDNIVLKLSTVSCDTWRDFILYNLVHAGDTYILHWRIYNIFSTDTICLNSGTILVTQAINKS